MDIGMTLIPSHGYLESWREPLRQQIMEIPPYVVFSCVKRCDSEQKANILHFLSLFEPPLHMMVVIISSQQSKNDKSSNDDFRDFLRFRVAQNMSTLFFWSIINSKV